MAIWNQQDMVPVVGANRKSLLVWKNQFNKKKVKENFTHSNIESKLRPQLYILKPKHIYIFPVANVLLKTRFKQQQKQQHKTGRQR